MTFIPRKSSRRRPVAPLVTLAAVVLLTFRTLQVGSYATVTPPAPKLTVVRDAATLRSLWHGETPPSIDFEKDFVVFLFAGQKNTGGWSIEVRRVSTKGKFAIVDAHVQGPPRGGMVTQALTSPYAAIAFPKSSATRVRWVDGTRVVDEEKAPK